MVRVYVSVGSNIDPEHNIRRALDLFSREVRIDGISLFYRTRPLGSLGSPEFYNGVIRAETELEPRALKFGVLRRIEAELGRARKADPNAPRTIDLDILLYGEVQISEPDIQVPDPDLTQRSFLAAPLLELDPGAVLPDGRRLDAAAAALDRRAMAPLEDFTRNLRQEILNEP